MNSQTTPMIEGSQVRHSDHSIDKLFLNRWSPRAMATHDITDEDLNIMFEAARWAPSSYNNQPWRILYAKRKSAYWPIFFDLLVEGNKVWAKNAAVLLVFVSKTTFDFNSKPSVTHSFDTGAAWACLALQGYLRGYAVHGMEGFDYERAKKNLKIPEEYRVEAMAAIGRPGIKEDLPDKLQQAEHPNGRKKLSETICEGPFNWL